MSKYSSSEEIYNELVENSEENWILGSVAFAVIEEQRIEWMEHQRELTGELPTHEEIKRWYEFQPNGVLLRARDTAETRLKDYSNDVVELIAEDLRREIEEGMIIGEIRELKRFWPQFGVNLAGGLMSALLFALTLSLLAFILFNDVSPKEISTNIKDKIEESYNGK